MGLTMTRIWLSLVEVNDLFENGDFDDVFLTPS